MGENAVRCGLFIGFAIGALYGARFGPSWFMWGFVALCLALGLFCGAKAFLEMDDEVEP